MMTKMNKKYKKAILISLVMALPIGLLISSASSNLQLSAADTFTPYESSAELTLDGIGDDAAWGSATPLVVTTTGGTLGTVQTTLKAVYTDANIYILASWADSTFSITRGRYNVSGGLFDQTLTGGGSEDRIAFLWEIGTIAGFSSSGCQLICHGGSNTKVNFTGDDDVGDMWHIKAARGGGVTSATIVSALTIDPASYEATMGTVALNGFADDKHLDNIKRTNDAGEGATYDNTNGTHAEWIEANPTDWLDAMILTETEILNDEAINITEALTNSWANLTLAVSNYTTLNANVPRHILRLPSGSRGDIEVAMRWSDGVWTVEVKRALVTGNTDDVDFSDTSAGMYHFSLAIFDNEGQEITGAQEHTIYTGPIALTFATAGPAPAPAIPGFSLILILGILFAVSAASIKLRKSRMTK